jgi:Apea-like HEPN
MVHGFQLQIEPRDNYPELFSFEDVKHRWSEILSMWRSYHKKLQEVFNLYFAVLLGNQLFVEHKFLFLAQAIEGYHRIVFTGQSPRIQFKQRISQILERSHNVFSIFINDFSEFRSLVEDGRNQLSHPGDPKYARSSEEPNWGLLASQLRAMLEISFLNDLAITGQSVHRVAVEAQHRFTI